MVPFSPVIKILLFSLYLHPLLLLFTCFIRGRTTASVPFVSFLLTGSTNFYKLLKGDENSVSSEPVLDVSGHTTPVSREVGGPGEGV